MKESITPRETLLRDGKARRSCNRRSASTVIDPPHSTARGCAGGTQARTGTEPSGSEATSRPGGIGAITMSAAPSRASKTS